MTVTDKFVFFWGGEYSQWFLCEFMEDQVKFSSTEKYMMYHKAMHFKDGHTAHKIMLIDNPKLIKALGREVTNFNPNEWDKVKEEIVYKGNLLKFSQNVLLKDLMCLHHMNKIFVEASPLDPIWGIGMSEKDPGITDPSNWKGQNLLGKALNRVQATLLGS